MSNAIYGELLNGWSVGRTHAPMKKRTSGRVNGWTDQSIVCFSSLMLFLTLLHLQRMRKIKPFKLADVTRILNPEERQRMLTGAVNRILAAESESTSS